MKFRRLAPAPSQPALAQILLSCAAMNSTGRSARVHGEARPAVIRAFSPASVVDDAIRIASTRLRNVARIERVAGGDVLTADVASAAIVQPLVELVIEAAGLLDEPRVGCDRWLRIGARPVGEAIELWVESAADAGRRSVATVRLALPQAHVK